MNLQTTGFDYAQLDAETRIEVQQRTRNIKSIGKRVACEIFEMGEEFAAVRKLLSHNKTGGFEAWYEAEGFAKNTVYRCIDVYETFANLPKLGRLDIPLSALYELSAHSTPESARVQIVKRAEAGEKITLKETKQVISEAKPKPLPPLTYSKPIDDYQPEVPEVEIDTPYQPSGLPIVSSPPARMTNGHLSPNAPVGTVVRGGKAEASTPLIPMVNAPHLNPAANGKPYTNGSGAHPVDSTKLQAEVDRLRAENERLTTENTKLKAAAALTVQPLLMTRAAAYGITPTLTSKYTARYGEDTLRSTINYLIDLNLKADDRDLLKKVLETVKPSGAIKYPNDVKKWKSDHTAAYYREFDTVLDALRTAWGQDCKLSHWEDLTLSEQKDFISVQQELSGKLDCSEYPALVKYVRVWKDAPLSMLAKKVTEWRQSLNVPSADDDFKKLWGGEEEFIPTAENTDPQQAAEVREVMNGLLTILDNNMKELEVANAG